MRELAEFHDKVTVFLENIRKNAHEIFLFSQKFQKEGKEFREVIFRVEKEVDEINKNFQDMVLSVNRVYEDVSFLSSRLSDFSLFVKEKYHEFITIINSLKRIEVLGDSVIAAFEDIFFVSRNAEIRAFHLGEKGAGLSVVARELSRLTQKVKEKIEEFRVPLSRLKEYYTSSEEFSSRFIEKLEYVIPKQKLFEELFEKIKESKDILETTSVTISTFLANIKLAIKNLNDFIKRFILTAEETVTIGENASNLISLISGIHETLEFNEKILKILKSPEKRKFPREKINLLLEDFEKIVKVVSRSLEEISKNIENWTGLLEDAEKQFDSQERGDFKKEVERIESVFREVFRERISLVEKESYSLVDSIRDMFQYMNSLKEIEVKAKDSMDILERRTLSLKALVKDGDILSIYSLIETKRAGLDDDTIARELKSLVGSAEVKIKEIIDLSYSLEKKGVFVYDTDTNPQEIADRTESLGREIPALESGVGKVLEMINTIKDFDNNLSIWQSNVSMFFENIYKTQRRMKDEIEKIKLEIEEFFKGMQRKRFFEPPDIIGTRKEILKLVITSDPVTLNPYLAEDSISHTIVARAHKGLFTLSPVSTKILPGIADNFEISRDGMKYTISLRKNVYFHNGKVLTPFEVYDSLKKALKGTYKNFFIMIEGAENYVKGIADEVEGIKIIDENILEINLEYPFAPFLSNLTLLNASITCEDNGRLYGAGSYVLKEWERGEKIILERFDKYFYGTPYFHRIEYLINPPYRNVKSVIDGKLHYLSLSPQEVKELKTDFPEYLENLEKVPALSIQKLDFNNEVKPFDVVEVRKAICYAISAREFVEEIFEDNALPAKSVFPPGYEFYSHHLKGYNKDIEKARELLKKAGFENGFEFVLSYNPRGVYNKAYEFIKKALAELNINVIPERLEWADLLEKSRGEGVQSIMIGWGADTPDPDAFIFPLFHSSERKHTRFKDKEIDELIEKARKERNIEERKRLYTIIEQKVLEKAPCVFLYHPLIIGLRNEKILGISPHPILSSEVFYAVKND